MGTRAIITKDGVPFICIHWDGYVSSLGKDLVSLFTDEEIIQAASGHVIDFASSEVRGRLNASRVRALAKKHSLSEREIKRGTRRGNVFSARDYQIGSIDNYGDFAEYQYNLRNGVWFACSLSGLWPDVRRSEWKELAVWIEEEEGE